MKTRISPKSAKPSPFLEQKNHKPSKPAKPAIFGIWESMEDNSESTKGLFDWYQFLKTVDLEDSGFVFD